MSRITTHVLDTSRGRPAANMEVTLERSGPAGQWVRLGVARTDSNGRVSDFPGAGPLAPGIHRLRFETGAYFASQPAAGFFPVVEITFEVSSPGEHQHVPLLLSPFGFSTYRGS